ncbi:hypothetical protein EON82_13225 [bacterium]|nr:MAG: hypothetical protein EON82_13225 [bacterium]
MGEGTIRLFRAIPGPTGLGPIVAKFCRDGEGLLTAFDDAALVSLAALRPDEECEVIGFPALVQKALMAAGEPHGRLAASGHQQATIAHALSDLPRDSIFGAGANHPGLHRALLRTLHELHAFGIDADEMEALASGLPDPLGTKLAEMAVVDQTLIQTLDALGRDTHGRHLKACLEALTDADGEDCRALVLVGGERHPARLRWLRWAAEAGWDLTVVVERHATDGRLFDGAREAEEILGVPAQDVGTGHRLLNNLFARGAHDGPALELAIRSAPDPLAECEWALRGCLEAGPERCGLYIRDLPTYAPLLQAVARRLGVPVCAPQRVPLLTNAFARLTLAVVEFAAGNDVRTLRPVLSSSYLALDGFNRRVVEGGLREAHRMRLLQWDTLNAWAEAHVDRFPWLVKVLQWRESARSAGDDLGGWLDRLRALVHELPWHGAYGGEAYDPARDVRAFSAMQTALANEASVERAVGAVPLDLSGFARRCRTLWEAADVSVPTPEVGVPVATHASALTGVHTLFVLGMLEGSFPRRASQDPILGDEERRAISRLRPIEPPLPLSVDRAAEERDEFYRVCASATHRLVLSYPQADDSRDNVPAFYLEAAAQAAGGATRTDLPRTLLAPPRESCLSAADRAMRAALDAPRERPAPAFLSEDSSRIVVAAPPGERTASELRDALRCAFLYAARHRLHLRPNRREQRWHRLRSLPQAARLLSAEDATAAKRALEEALEAELDTLASEVPEWEIPLLRAGGQRLVADWLTREFAARKLWPMDEGTLRLNVPFGGEGVRSSMPLGVTLSGVAPAVSRFGATKTMHLYSGTMPPVKDFTEADRLFFGLHLLALHEPGAKVQLEVESTNGRRTRLRLDRGDIRRLPAAGLDMEWLVDEDDRDLARRVFFEGVKDSLRRALRTVEVGDMRPSPGDPCDTCEFGELCRRSRAFGEDDSPFGADLRTLGAADS